ncbi:MAG: dihydroxyacetone kinase subunit L [Planctomycetes bacterium]|nr:dihydroxyacetone kinase subunit L [Planctomycetota bacterium]
MMSSAVGYDDLVSMLRGAAERIRKEHATLSRLDSHGGDGDHGTTMLRAVNTLETTVETSRRQSIADLLEEVGWAILGVDGGATGPLLGMFFTGMAEAARGHDSLDAAALSAVFESGLASVERQTEARVGDKTMMDALVPAVRVLRSASDAGSDVVTALRRAAAAAVAGAESTRDLEARFGRAKQVGARSVGHPDPGATSMGLMFQGFLQGVE